MSECVLAVTIEGDPVGKARPRVRKIKIGKEWVSQLYTPKKTRNWEKRAAETIWRTYSLQPHGGLTLDEPLQIVVRAVKKRPKSMQAKQYPRGRLLRSTKPDGDNVLKSAQDAAQQSGFVVDDSRFAKASVESYYTATNEEPRVEIEVYKLTTVHGEAGLFV